MSTLAHNLPLFLAIATGLSACGDCDAAPRPAVRHAAVAAALLAPPPQAMAINQAAYVPTPSPVAVAVAADGAVPVPSAPDPVLVRAEVLLARAHFSAGAVMGTPRETLRTALAAFQTSRRLSATGELDAATWDALTVDSAPALGGYVLTRADVSGGYGSNPRFADPLEMLGERFHMSRALLQALNPDADFSRAGTLLAVADTGPAALNARVTRIEVDKGIKALRAYDAAGQLVAFYPTTVGSPDTPSPSGVVKVLSVTPNPYYVHSRSRVSFGSGRGYSVMPGPNNPVGLVWIELSRPTYGIHGTPEPEKIGQAASHGCVRLTNWDAQQLGAAVMPGAVVTFVEAPPAA